MAEANIDTLQIQISAESTDAASKVNALTEALKGLQEVLNKIQGGSIISKIKDIGTTAQKATSQIGSTKTNAKKETYAGNKPAKNLALENLFSEDLKNQAKEVSDSIDKINQEKLTGPDTKQSETALDKVKTSIAEIGEQTDKSGIKISDLQRQLTSLELKQIREAIADTGAENISKGIDKAESQLSAYTAQALKASEMLDGLKTRMGALDGKKGLTVFADKGIDNASQKIQELEKYVNEADAKAKELQSALNAVGSGSKDIGISQIRELVNEYRSANEVVKAFGGIANSAMKDAEKAVSQAEKEIADGFTKAFKDLQKVDLSSIVDVEKLKSKLSGLSETLDKLQGTRMLPKEDYEKLAYAETKMQDFANTVKTASILSSQLGTVLRGINDGSINMSAQAVRDLVDSYKLAKANASAAGEAAKAAMDIAKNSVKSAEQAVKDYNKALEAASSVASKGGIDMPKMETQVSKIQSKLAELQNIKGIQNIAGPGLQDAVKKILEFQMSASFAEQELENLKKQIEDIQSGKIQATQEEVEKLADKYKQAKQAAEEYGAGAKSALDKISEQVKQPKVDTKEIEKIKESLNRSLQSDVASALPKIIDSIKTKASELIDVLEQTGNTGWAMALRAAFYIINTAIQAVKDSLKALKAGFDALKPALISIAKEANKAALALAKLYTSGLKEIGKGFANVGKYIAQDFVKPITSAIKFIDTWKKSLGRIAFYRAVRSALKMISDGFKTGIDNLYQYSSLMGTQFKPAMDSLATSALYLKNSLGAMAAPLIQALAPAIDFIIDKFVALLNIIGKVFAALTGKSVYTQAKKHAVEYGDAAKAANKATKDFVLGIDELNIINDNAGGGGGAGGGFEDMFEEVEVPSDIADWANEIREAIANGEWYKVGELVAQKLNEIVDKWDSYAWGQKLGQLINNGLNVAYGFLKTFDFENLGKKVGEGIMGIFDTVDWDLLGRVFAAKWNALFDFIYGFAKAIRWKDIGDDIATALNGWIDEIDPSKAARAINEFIGGILLAAMEAIEQTKWYTLGTKIGELINGIDWYTIIHRALMVIVNAFKAAIELINGVLDTWKFEKTALQIATAINDAFKEFPWSSLGMTLGRLIITAFDFLRETIANIEWGAIGKDIQRFLVSIPWSDIIESFKNLMEEIAKAMKELLHGLIDDFPEGILPKILKVIGIIVKGILSSMISNKTVLLVEGAAILIAIFNEFGDKIKEFVGNLAEQINEFVKDFDWKRIGEYIGTGINNALEAAIIFIEGLDWNIIWEAIAKLMEGVDLKETFKNITILFVDAIEALLIGAPEIIKMFSDVVAGIGEGFTEKLPELGEIFGKSLGDTLKDFINGIGDILNAIEWIKVADAVLNFLSSINWIDVLSSLGTLIGDAIGSAISLAAGAVVSLVTHIPDILKIGAEIIAGILLGIKNAVVGIATTLYNTFVKPVIDAVKNLFGIHSPSTVFAEIGGYLVDGLVKGLSDTWKNIVDFFKKSFESLKNSIGDWWNGIKEDTGKKWDEIKTTLSNKWDAIKTFAKNTWESIVATIKEVWSGVAEFLSETWDGIKNTAEEVWNAVKDFFDTIWDGVKEKTEETWNGIVDFFTELWDTITTNIQEAWGAITQFLSDTWNGIKGTAEEIWNAVKDFFETIWNGIKEKVEEIWNGIKEFFETTWNAIKEKVEEVWNAIKTFFEETWNNIKNTIEEVWQSITTFLTETWETIKTNVKEKFESIRDTIKDIWESVKESTENIWNGIWNTIKGIINTILGGIEKFVNGIINGVNKAIRALNSLKIDIPSWVPGIGGNSLNLHIRELQEVTIPRLASGGIVDSGQMFIAREAGPELVGKIGNQTAVVNNEQIIEGISDGVKDANEDVINALYNMAEQIVEAIGTISDRPIQVSFDRKTLVNQVERGQRERGANIMRGGVNG